MAIYNVHAGHCPDGSGASGAVGYLKESTEARKVKDRVISVLRKEGNTVYDCTDNTNCTELQNLIHIVKKCNSHRVELDISVHLNAGGGNGVEVWCYDQGTQSVAFEICNQISTQLRIPNRGVKYSTDLYVLRNTISPAILIECCFVDSFSDTKVWNADLCGDAIASAILGRQIYGSKISQQPPVRDKNDIRKENWVAELQRECNRQGFSNQVVDGIAGINTLNGCPTLDYGARGNITRIMQSQIGTLPDGIFGINTKSAVILYQKKNGLVQDGIVGRNTWSKILGLG